MAQASNVREIEDIPEFTTKKPDAPQIEQRFRLDGELYTLLQPKTTIAMYMLNLAEGTDAHTTTEIGTDMLNLTRSIIGYIKEEKPDANGNIRGQARLINRLNDPKDELDLDTLAALFNDLIAKLYADRPTGPRPASSRQPRTKSAASGAGTRSRRAATSGR